MDNDYPNEDDFLQPLRRLKRAEPSPLVWEGILAQTERQEAKEVPMIAWRRVAAAAAIVLLLNTAGIIMAANNNGSQSSAAYGTETSLVTDFQLYD
ncbi:MAG: hypothetical protein AAF597_07850 [Bacteroidota bacterium]